MSTTVVMVYATFPNLEEAERIGGELVEAGLAACVNLLPGMKSIYRWEDALQRDDEIVMIAKTRADRVDALISALTVAHSYDTPAVVALPITAGAPEYLDWVLQETAPSAGQ